MSRKSKITVLTFVAIAVLAILLVSNTALFAPGEEETGPGEEEFKATADPYSVYTEALDREKPVVVKFYARW